jgi:hypothetical protein
LKNTTDKLQALSAKLRGSINTLPWFPVFSALKLLPPKKKILEGAVYLSKISYAPHENDKEKVSKQIEKLYELLDLNMYEK